jgi:glutamine amidotransferase-like uncharacterized protein
MRHRAILFLVVLLLVAGCAALEPPPAADILLFTGHGTSPGDVAAFADLLHESGMSYATASSAQLDAIGEPELKAYRLIIVPGGNFVEIGNGLSADTPPKIRAAVRGGVGYLGVCAGAFFAGASPYNGIDLTTGVRFEFYTLEKRGVRKAPVFVNRAGGPPIEMYWEDGPQLTGWGQPVATYPDGTPAVVQGRFGDGWVVLAGVHAEAPESWRRGLPFTTPMAPSRAYATTLVNAALTRTPLPPRVDRQ